jgi:ankyrin repeat protein
VAALLARGADPGRRFTRRGTPLSEAAQSGHLAVVDLLLQAGADPNLSESESPEGDFNPLFQVVYSGHLEIVRRLLAAGADQLRKGPGAVRASSITPSWGRKRAIRKGGA